MKKKFTLFDYQAEMGLTKHLGGFQSTQELIELCSIEKGKYMLDVGCGVGATPCYIAKNYGCRVAGVDINARMVERSRERAENEGVESLTEFRVGNAQSLPYEDGLFDAVIVESVTAFARDKEQAVNEYVRVIKPGGYVGMNESTWLKPDPTPEMMAWVAQDLGSSAVILTSEGWAELLENAGLKDLVVKTYGISGGSEFKNIVKRYGLGYFIRVLGRTFSMYRRNPEYKAFVKELRASGVIPKKIFEYLGYGLYVGMK